MADNLNVTEGTGKVVGTDEVTRNAVLQHMQIIKLGLGAENAFDTVLDSGAQSGANSLPIVMNEDQAVRLSNSLTGTGLTGSYATALAVSSNKLKILDIYNGTDQDLLVSFDASTDHLFFPAYTGRLIDYKAVGLYEASNVSVKHAGTVPTTGKIYLCGWY